jgi:hypothetical protein
MERWERERILGEWGVREGTARSQNEGSRLAEDMEGSPLKGRPIRRRLRNFRPDAASYIASLGGPRPYMTRLREIHDLTVGHELRLAEEWARLAEESGSDETAFATRWRALAERWNFYEVNDLIERHNRWYPMESNLPMDPKTGDFVKVDGKPYRRRPLDAAWVLERFPPLYGDPAAPEAIEERLADLRAARGIWKDREFTGEDYARAIRGGDVNANLRRLGVE